MNEEDLDRVNCRAIHEEPGTRFRRHAQFLPYRSPCCLVIRIVPASRTCNFDAGIWECCPWPILRKRVAPLRYF
jgi:hypothetical protein